MHKKMEHFKQLVDSSKFLLPVDCGFIEKNAFVISSANNSIIVKIDELDDNLYVIGQHCNKRLFGLSFAVDVYIREDIEYKTNYLVGFDEYGRETCRFYL